MNCQDFERIWNEQLDAREAASAEVEQAQEAHAAVCPACQAISRRYLVLRQAIRVWGPPPAAPAGFADRFLRQPGALAWRPARWVALIRPAAGTVAVAAVLLLAVVAGGRRGWFHPAAPASTPERTLDPQALSTALAEASSATLSLARATSAPAARIGREVLVETRLAGAAPPPLPVDLDPGAEVLQRVSDGVNAGVIPISGTARHAFGFLLGPAPVERTPPRRSNKGT
jgi:hypothetical protein